VDCEGCTAGESVADKFALPMELPADVVLAPLVCDTAVGELVKVDVTLNPSPVVVVAGAPSPTVLFPGMVYKVFCPVIPPVTPVAAILAITFDSSSHTGPAPPPVLGTAKHELPCAHGVTVQVLRTHSANCSSMQT